MLKAQKTEKDSSFIKRSLLVVPYATYQEETSFAPGISFSYHFKSNDYRKISSINAFATYSFLNQFIFRASPKIYFENTKWYLYANFNIRNYIDYFYGIGNKPSDLKQLYTSQLFYINLQPQYEITDNLFIGPNLSYAYEQIKTDESFAENKDFIYANYGDIGWEKAHNRLALGFVSMYNKRDNSFYTQNGYFAKITYNVSVAGLGSTYTTHNFSLDYRHFIPVFKNHTLGLQAYTDAVLGKKIPFSTLPGIGGSDYLRGFRQGMYRDNIMFVFQTEYRLPIYKRFKAAFFASLGDVVNSRQCQIEKIKFSYGAGLRFRYNDAGAHLRFDIARNNYGDGFQFYLTASEAF